MHALKLQVHVQNVISTYNTSIAFLFHYRQQIGVIYDMGMHVTIFLCGSIGAHLNFRCIQGGGFEDGEEQGHSNDKKNVDANASFRFSNSSLGSDPDVSAEANMRKGLELSAFFSGQSSHKNSDGAQKVFPAADIKAEYLPSHR